MKFKVLVSHINLTLYFIIYLSADTANHGPVYAGQGRAVEVIIQIPELQMYL